MDWLGLTQFALLVAGAFCAAPFFFVGIRLLHVNRVQYDKARAVSRDLETVFFGELPSHKNGQPNPMVSRSVTIERQERPDGSVRHVWLPQGKLAREAEDAVLE